LPSDLGALNRWERELIDRFKTIPLFRALPDMPDQEFLDLLLQRRFISLMHTEIYDLAIDGLLGESAIRKARRILRQAYPGSDGTLPSHQELLRHGLELIGVSRDHLDRAARWPVTSKYAERVRRMLRKSDADAISPRGTIDHQIRLLTILRFWGEALVSVEHGLFWPRLSDLGLSATRGEPNCSRFYYPHLSQDAVQYGFSSPSLHLSETHADLLGSELEFLLRHQGPVDPTAVGGCARIEETIIEDRIFFYSQFGASPLSEASEKDPDGVLTNP
jgi:hypothetical protein